MILLSQDDAYSSMVQGTIGIEIEKVREGRRWGFNFLAYFHKFENDGRIAILNMLSNSGLEIVVRLLAESVENADGYKLSSLVKDNALSESTGA